MPLAPGWTAHELLELLDAIDVLGYGYWEGIAKSITLRVRTPDECKEVYNKYFLDGLIGKATWATVKKQTLEDLSVDDLGPLGAFKIDRLPPIECTLDDAQSLGYMSQRDMFERESDPAAEKDISGMTLTATDTDIEVALKLSQVDVYVRRLRERHRRKRIVRDYQLVRKYFHGPDNATFNRVNMLKKQREFDERYRVFAQFYSALEFERHLNQFAREKLLLLRVSELCRYRWNGLQRFDEINHFEQHVAAENRDTGPYGQYGRTVSDAKHRIYHNAFSFSFTLYSIIRFPFFFDDVRRKL